MFKNVLKMREIGESLLRSVRKQPITGTVFVASKIFLKYVNSLNEAFEIDWINNPLFLNKKSSL